MSELEAIGRRTRPVLASNPSTLNFLKGVGLGGRQEQVGTCVCRIALIRELIKWGIAYGKYLEIGALSYKSNELGESRRQVERVVGAIDVAMTETCGHIDERGKVREE